jgi:hypothetical protein
MKEAGPIAAGDEARILKIVQVHDCLSAPQFQLQHPRLNALQANEEQYRVLILQPQGKVRLTENGVGYFDGEHELAVESFFKTATDADRTPDVVVCPEYSVPWEVLLRCVEGNVLPQEGRLWVLGCESLQLGKLDEYRERLKGKAIVIDEDPDFSTKTTQRFLNPLVYVFRTTSTQDGSAHTVLLVQYKTKPSGDPDNFEAQGMFPGRNMYLFGRPPEEVKLLTMICSDAFDIPKATLKKHYEGLLLLHIQLNNNPRNTYYKQYRTTLFESGGDTTELLCLNWAEDVKIYAGAKADEKEWKNIGGSAWYLRPSEFDRSDATLTENHKRGFYYTFSDPLQVHALHFHYAQRAFLLRSTKVRHHDVLGPASYRVGPKVESAFDWELATKSWKPIEKELDDGFTALLKSANSGKDLPDLSRLHGLNPVSVERVLAICAGNFGPKQDWHAPMNIDSMKLCEEEVVQRVTVTLDPKGADFRSRRLASGRDLLALRDQGFQWPEEVGFLRDGFSFRWDINNPHRNVVTPTGKLATVIHAGSVGDMRRLEVVDLQARRALVQIPESDEVLSEDAAKEYRRKCEAQVARLCILHTTVSGSVPYWSRDAVGIASPSNMGLLSIAASGKRPKDPDALGEHK